MTRPNVMASACIGRIRIYIFTYTLITMTLVTSSCGVTPYRSEFSCSLRDDFGKCISVDGAYQEAVTGVDSGAPTLSRKGKSVFPTHDDAVSTDGTLANSSTVDRQEIYTANASLNADQYGAYRSSVYQQLRSMLTSPTAPILRPASTVRTLIISYANKEQGNRLYMPRYVFTISRNPEFVHGSYLDRRPGGDSGSLIDARAVALDTSIK